MVEHLGFNPSTTLGGPPTKGRYLGIVKEVKKYSII